VWSPLLHPSLCALYILNIICFHCGEWFPPFSTNPFLIFIKSIIGRGGG
jgi:hypothetical protein